jgi:hypothetical protein
MYTRSLLTPTPPLVHPFLSPPAELGYFDATKYIDDMEFKKKK